MVCMVIEGVTFNRTSRNWNLPKKLKNDWTPLLLIVPVGIEIINSPAGLYASIVLLIVPVGIEIFSLLGRLVSSFHF